jgi:hypothetical protein
MHDPGHVRIGKLHPADRFKFVTHGWNLVLQPGVYEEKFSAAQGRSRSLQTRQAEFNAKSQA